MSFDSPSLVASLAGNVGQYKAGEIQNQQNLDWSRYNLAAQGQAFQQDLANRRFAAEQAAAQQQPAAPQLVPTSAWTETDPNGATIYHPAGEQQLPAQMAAQVDASHAPAAAGPAQQRQYGVKGGGGNYVTPQQRAAMSRVDQMEQAGYLQPAEAQRWRGIIEGGGNPFDKPTLGEQESVKGAGKSDPNQLNANESTNAQLRGQQEQAALEKQQYERQRQSLLDQATVIEKRLSDVTVTGDARKQLITQLDQIRQQLGGLPGSFKGTATPDSIGKIIKDAIWGAKGKSADADGPAVRLEGNTITNAPPPGSGPAPSPGTVTDSVPDKANGYAGAGGSSGAKPVTPAVMQRFLTLAGGDVVTAKKLALKAGFDPSNIVQE